MSSFFHNSYSEDMQEQEDLEMNPYIFWYFYTFYLKKVIGIVLNI